MERLLNWLKNNPAGKVVAIFFFVLAVLVVVYSARSLKSEAIDRTHERLFMDSETGKTFTLELKPGLTFPVTSPFSGKATGYPPEACYWNSDGTSKSEPTYVILNRYLGKNGPTFCPDCGRLVVENNPPPNNIKAPPTKEQYMRRFQQAGNPN